MRRLIVSVAVVVLLSFIGSQVCSAQLINYNRRNRAGAPANAGYRNTPQNTAPQPAPAAPAVPPSMPAAVKQEAYGMNENKSAHPPMPTNAVLKEVVAAVNKNGSTKVISDILKKYDKNKDGMISKAEAKAIEADIR